MGISKDIFHLNDVEDQRLGAVQKSPSSKAAALGHDHSKGLSLRVASFVGNRVPAVSAITGAQVTRRAYWQYVSTEEWRERR